MRESRTLEFKQSVTNTFLKTVCAYANYGTGKILFGVKDDGSVIGIENPVQSCLDIENKVNDSIDPVPIYTLEINEKTKVITLTVKEGTFKPYFYKSKAYIRNDSSSIEVDRLELSRLILEGKNMSFEELPSKTQELNFTMLERRLKEELNVDLLSMDILKTLELYSDNNGYNIAAQLLADQNDYPGIDSVRFGDSIDILQDRECFSKQSILIQYERIIEKFCKYYEYEEIKGAYRNKVEMIPEKAFREAIANALVHRTWDINANINVSMYKDKIEISSPGGLPKGISDEIYRNGGISIPRNPIIANVFLRLNMIERFGTGIRRINETYQDSETKPIYRVFNDMIQIILPVIKENSTLSTDERIIVDLLRNTAMSTSSVATATGFGKTKSLEILNKLVDNGYLQKIGNGRGTKYTLV